MKHKKKSLDGSSTSYSGKTTGNNFSCDSKDNVDLPLTQAINDKATFYHILESAYKYDTTHAPGNYYNSDTPHRVWLTCDTSHKEF